MKEINYQDILDAKIQKTSNQPNGTAFVSVDGQYKETPEYPFYRTEWILYGCYASSGGGMM